ncbi:TldD/PmbA family protein [Mangrovicoccus algicola]|uniref:TldD/PmbA family protein n=1 Tax=Mangrovicoccus algicola TaxID=2771008 RepID=A0A8J6YVZ4_9RHOB|nr:TldD/PmbA family protein [Mangrovicoccus algicola]MBE3638762.1 TldD/PmbA family protein [Mangrovicoccus algicola]
MSEPLSDLAEALLAAARAAGAEDADAIVTRGTSVSIGLQSRKLEDVERSESVDLGLRVLIGRRQACVSSSDIRRDTFAAMAERAVAMAREAPEDPWIGLAAPDQLARDWDAIALDLVDPEAEPDPARLEAAAREAEAVALDIPGISQVESAGAGFSRRALHMAATNGFSGGYARTDHGLYCVAITGTGAGMERDYHGSQRTHRADLEPAADIGRIAAERTLARAGARRPPTGTYPVLYDERISGSLIAHLLSAINGSAIARGASWARDLLGQPVLPAGLSLTEQPHRARIIGSRPFDGEGLPTTEREIIRDGVLTGWTLDLATARQLGMTSTGSATRGTSAPPAPANGNVALSQGSATPRELMAQMGTGLLVTSMIGATINPTTGDYSRGASGIWIENGQPAYPVNECTIAGNLRDMLGRIIPANDARPYLSRVIPSLLVEGMSIAGE